MGTIATTNDLETRRRLSGAAVAAFFKIADLWSLSTDEQLELLGMSISRTLLFEWKRAPEKVLLNADQIMRMSYLLAIYEGLQRIWRRTPREADAWVRRENTDHPFLGETPLAFILVRGLPGLEKVRTYIDSETGGPPSREWYPRPPREA